MVIGDGRGQHWDVSVDNTCLHCVSVWYLGMAEGSIGMAEVCGQLHLECVIGMAEGRIIRFQSCV